MEVPSYWKKQEKPLFSDLTWNLPERKSGSISVIGGNSQSFSVVNRTSSKLARDYPVRDVISVLPDSLRRTIPPVPGLLFCPSTTSGGFAKSSELSQALKNMDYNLIVGDLSKNSETSVAIADAVAATEKPTILARDTVDLLTSDMPRIVEKGNITLICSMMQLQKVFRAVYYPKVLLLSMPILPVVEALHKFTLSYPLTILTFHEGLILTARDGDVYSTKITQAHYSPLSLWDGTLAADIAALHLYNPSKPLESATAAILID